MSDFPTTITPTKDSNKETETKIIEASFGDNYTQRAADGINNVFDSWSFIWTCLDSTAYLEMVTFLEARGGWDDFNFTPPGESVSKKFVCKKWTTSHPGDSKYQLGADFVQVFDL